MENNIRLRKRMYFYYLRYLKPKRDKWIVIRGLINMLKFVDESNGFIKHYLAQYFPQLIKPDILSIHISLTSNCNFLCKGCTYGRTFMPSEKLSFECVKELLDDIEELKIPFVHFYGGEPLLHPELPKMVEYATQRGIHTSLGTNGLLLNKRKMKELADAGLKAIAIGLPEVGNEYNKFVGLKNKFQNVEENIRSIRELYPDIILSLGWLISKQTCNSDSLNSFLQFSEKYEIPFGINLIHYDFPYSTDGENHELQLYEEDREQIELLIDKLITHKKKHPSLMLNTLVGLKSIPDWLILKENMKVPCSMYSNIWVGPNGEVKVCQKNIELGNLENQRFVDIINTEDHTKAIRTCFKLDCSNCQVRFDYRTRYFIKTRIKYNRMLSVNK